MTLGKYRTGDARDPFYCGFLRTHTGVGAEFKVLCPFPSPYLSGPLHPRPLQTPELPARRSMTGCSQLQIFSAVPSEFQILLLGHFLEFAQQVQSFHVFF